VSSPADRVLDRLFGLTVVLADAMAEDLARRGLTRARATLLSELHRSGPVTQRALATALRVSPRNITGLVNALESGGLVTRSPHPTDGRAFLVELTAEGGRAASALADEHHRLAELLFGRMRAADRDALAEDLDRLLHRLGDPAFDAMRRAALERWQQPASAGG
jgi:DNA-binding MarR family transcriptional regulator